MKISIITPTFNSARTIADTIDSIVAQNYADIEYIVVDGVSTDGTLDIVRSYQNKIPITIISEPDKGIYDAMNKGISRATGDIVGILNSDDFFHDEAVLKNIAEAFEKNPDADAVYGDLMYIDKDKKEKATRYWKSGEYKKSKLRNGWIMPHPTLFVRNALYKKMSPLFRISFSVAADYELMFRMLYIHDATVHYIPKILVTMRRGGKSGRNLSNRLKGWAELRNTWKVNGQKVPAFFITRRIFGKLAQFLFF